MRQLLSGDEGVTEVDRKAWNASFLALDLACLLRCAAKLASVMSSICETIVRFEWAAGELETARTKIGNEEELLLDLGRVLDGESKCLAGAIDVNDEVLHADANEDLLQEVFVSQDLRSRRGIIFDEWHVFFASQAVIERGSFVSGIVVQKGFFKGS